MHLFLICCCLFFQLFIIVNCLLSLQQHFGDLCSLFHYNSIFYLFVKTTTLGYFCLSFWYILHSLSCNLSSWIPSQIDGCLEHYLSQPLLSDTDHFQAPSLLQVLSKLIHILIGLYFWSISMPGRIFCWILQHISCNLNIIMCPLMCNSNLSFKMLNLFT